MVWASETDSRDFLLCVPTHSGFYSLVEFPVYKAPYCEALLRAVQLSETMSTTDFSDKDPLVVEGHLSDGSFGIGFEKVATTEFVWHKGYNRGCRIRWIGMCY